PLVRGVLTGRSVLERRTFHVADAQAEVDEYPESSDLARRFGFRTMLSVPMLRGEEAIGAIAVRRTEVRQFTDQQAELLKTFADQAVIAIENVRLFKELEARNRDLTESLNQQTATSEILRVISSSPTDLQPVFDAILRSAQRLLGARTTSVFRRLADEVHLAAFTSAGEAGDAPYQALFPMSLDDYRERFPFAMRDWVTGSVTHVPDVELDARSPEIARRLARARGFRSVLQVPMRREGQVIGVLGITRSEAGAFADDEIALAQTFADQAVIAIENVRLFTELEGKNRALTEAHEQVSEALERQTATSEILRVISGSPTNLQPVLEAVAERAARLCSADDVKIHLVDGDTLRLAAQLGPIPSVEARPIIPTRHIGRAVLERRTIHVHDMRIALDEFPDAAADLRAFGARTSLATPLLREGMAIGVIQIRRLEVEPFSEKQIALLETFADQAVIAIENVRLFTELQASNRELRTA